MKVVRHEASVTLKMMLCLRAKDNHTDTLYNIFTQMSSFFCYHEYIASKTAVPQINKHSRFEKSILKNRFLCEYFSTAPWQSQYSLP